MVTIVNLDINDLIMVLADYFKVCVEHVNLIPFIATEGYGMDEHDVPSIRAEIEITKGE